MRERRLAAVLTLGCKLNLADSEEIARGLRSAGFDVVGHVCEADAFVINTCSVTHVADAKSRGLIRSVRRLSPDAAVTVTGCFPQSAGAEAAVALGADLVVGTRDADKLRLVEFLAARTYEGAARTVDSGRTSGQERQGLHVRAFVKVQEGCNDVCAFCIVPRTRGREESRTVEAVVAEVARAVEAGAREVVLTGTQLGAWGRDFEAALKPQDLIAGVLERTEVPRVRFSSLQPQDISPELLALWQDPRLMPHFHLALQSGSDRTLAAMRRRYDARAFVLAAERIRAGVPGVAITTDVIAGFPGESEADFEATLRLCEEAGFSRLHCFPYSQRARTTAARMTEQVAAAVRRERMERLLALGERLSSRFREELAGEVRPVLWEGVRRLGGGRAWYGHADNHATVYSPIHEQGDGIDLWNRVTPVRVGAVYHDGVRGHFAGEAL
jgi:threonylcarbamoyladenosine tRNA methylthiotransferase MtaB